MIDIYVCEDMQKHQDMIVKNIEQAITKHEMDMRIVLATGNPHEVLKSLRQNHSVNAYFLDIDLKSDMNGLELAANIRKTDPRGYIVFVTTHFEMSLTTFEYKVEALDYIVKSSSRKYEEQIQAVVHTIHEKYLLCGNKKNSLSIRRNGRVFTEDYDQILFIEASATPHMVCMVAEDRQYEFTSTIKDLEIRLDDRFFRCSSSTIVNLDKLQAFEEKTRKIILENGDECTVSTRFVKKLKERLRQ